MFMKNVGVLSRLAYCMTWGRTRNYFFIYFFSAERAYTPVIFGCAFFRLMQSPWMERVTTMNQLTDIRNKSAESLKTKKKKKRNLLYVVRIGVFLY